MKCFNQVFFSHLFMSFALLLKVSEVNIVYIINFTDSLTRLVVFIGTFSLVLRKYVCSELYGLT